jgi:uncharacterized protein
MHSTTVTSGVAKTVTTVAATVAFATALAASATAAVAGAVDNTLADAVKNGDRAAVRTLLREPGAANAAAADGTTALHWAVRADDLATADMLIRAGAKVNVVNRFGVAPLTLAATNGNVAMIERLLKAGADANAKSPEGEPVIMTAARTGKVGLVRLLLAHGADANAREQWMGQSALMWAAADNHADVVGALLEAGAETGATGRIYADHELKPLDFGTPKAPTPKGGMAAIHYAARQGAVDAVRILADKGADLNQVDPDGLSALIYATINGHTDTAALLLERGANPNVADVYGRTVLYAALDLNRMEAVSPRPVPKTNDTTTALALATLAIAKGVALNTQITSGLPVRSTQGNNDSTPVGATPLWRAAKSSDIEGVRLLLQAGADTSLASRDGVTPFMVAAGQGWTTDWSRGTEEESVETLKLLLASGIDINARNSRGETALHGASDRGADNVVKYLAESGIALDAKDKSNRTALDIALAVPPTGGRNPFEYRSKYGSESTAALLREIMTAKGVTIETYTKP